MSQVITQPLRNPDGSSNYDICPVDGAPLVEPDGVSFTNLHCSKCDWEIGIVVTQRSFEEILREVMVQPEPDEVTRLKDEISRLKDEISILKAEGNQ
jgi:hypothetical protein